MFTSSSPSITGICCGGSNSGCSGPPPACANSCWVGPSLRRCCAVLSPINRFSLVWTNANHTSCLILNGAFPSYRSITSLRLNLSPSTVRWPLAQSNKQKTNWFVFFLTQFWSAWCSTPLPPLPGPKTEYTFFDKRQILFSNPENWALVDLK